MRGQVRDALADLGTKILELLLKAWEKLEPITSRIAPAIDVLTASLERILAEILNFIAEWTPTRADDAAARARLIASQAALAKAMKDFIDGVSDARDPLMDPFLVDFFRSGARAGLASLPILVPAGGVGP
jgi:hypothetical protein